MSKDALNKDYEKLQISISKLRSDWYNELKDQTVVVNEEIPTTTPIIPQLDLKVNYVQFEQFITELLALMEEKQPQLAEELKKVASLLNKEKAAELFKAAVEVNTAYFQKLSKEESIEEWLIPFVIESAVRPYLQKAAEELKPSLEKIKGPKQCPACGEPPRMAIIKKDGKKNILCPRCSHAWEEKKISCPHCGTDNHEHIVILQIDEDKSAEVYGCKNCNSYTKVLKTAEMMVVPNPDVLDIKSIIFDYVAQEKGYTSVKEEKTSH